MMENVSVEKEYDYIIIGGGIAGISCAELLSAFAPKATIGVFSLSRIFKVARNYSRVTKYLDNFDVVETSDEEWSKQFSNVVTIICKVENVDPKLKLVTVSSPKSNASSEQAASDLRCFKYRHSVCLCCGARPKLIVAEEEASRKHVLGIRDTHTVDVLRNYLEAERTRRLLVVGNGGIATELVFALRTANRIEMYWAVRDDSISSVFFDVGSAEFLLDVLLRNKEREEEQKNGTISEVPNATDDKYRTMYCASSA